MRRVPSARSMTSPRSLRTLRCCDTAGRLTGSAWARTVTDVGRSHSIVTIARRDGSASASIRASGSNTACVTTYVSYDERNKEVNPHHRIVELLRPAARRMPASVFGLERDGYRLAMTPELDGIARLAHP